MNSLRLFIILCFISACSGFQSNLKLTNRNPASLSCSQIHQRLTINKDVETISIHDAYDVLALEGIPERSLLALTLLDDQATYLIKEKGESVLKQDTFLGRLERDQKGTIRLVFINSKIELDQISGVRKINPVGEEIGEGLSRIINIPITGAMLRSHIFKPYKKLALRGSIEAVGNLLSSKDLGASLAESMQSFDSFMADFGFKTPERTRLIINDRPLFPGLVGPYSFNLPAFNIWSGRTSKIIAMEPIAWKTEVVGDESVLYHERMHALLHRTYSDSSFINQSQAFQEAFADFGASNFLGKTDIGYNAFGDNKPIRDIAKRSAQNEMIDSLLKVSGVQYHDDSLLVSHFLWRIRNQLGQKKMSRFTKELLDDLNRYYPSFEEIIETKDISKVQKFINDLEFFLAVLYKKSRDEIELDSISGLVDDYITELDMNMGRIRLLSNQLTLSENLFEYSDERELRYAAMVVGFGSAAILVEGGLLYKFFIEEDD